MGCKLLVVLGPYRFSRVSSKAEYLRAPLGVAKEYLRAPLGVAKDYERPLYVKALKPADSL